MHQMLLGASFPYIIALTIYFIKRCRASLPLLLLTPLFMGICAIWAVVPDIPRIIGLASVYRKLATDPRTDIFFWHYSIDQIEAQTVEKYIPLFTAIFVILITSLLLAAWHELYHRER